MLGDVYARLFGGGREHSATLCLVKSGARNRWRYLEGKLRVTNVQREEIEQKGCE